MDDDGAGYDVAQEFGADFGAVGNLRILRAQGFDVAVDFAAVDFAAVDGYEGLCGEAAGEGGEDECLDKVGFFHVFALSVRGCFG